MTDAQDEGDSTAYTYNDREQLSRYTTPEGDIIQYAYDGAGNRTARQTTIQGDVEDKKKVISSDELVQIVLASYGMKAPEPTPEPTPTRLQTRERRPDARWTITEMGKAMAMATAMATATMATEMAMVKTTAMTVGTETVMVMATQRKPPKPVK